MRPPVLRRLALATLFLALPLPALGAPAKKPAQPSGKRPARPPAAPPVPVPTVPPVPPLPPPARGEPAEALLERAAAAYAALEYDAVIPLAEAALAKEELSLAQKLEGYRLLGSAKAIVDDPAEAEKPFRLLLRAQPRFDLGPQTPPKILAVFRRVQLEERALAEQLRDVQRERTIASLKLLDPLPKTARGGYALALSFRLRDPTSAVEVVRVPYRRAGAPVFSSLALERASEGDWRGQIPAEFTSDERGFRMEYYVETADAVGPLLRVGAEGRPLALDVSAGTLAQARPPPVPRWAFFASAGLTAATGLAAGGLGLAFHSSRSALERELGAGQPLDGSLVAARYAQGEQLAALANGTLVGFGVTAVLTAVLAPLTNFAVAAP